MEEQNGVRVYQPNEIDLDAFTNSFVSCLILTTSGQLALQYRDFQFHTYPDKVCAFGGKIEEEESPDEAIVREIQEELSVAPPLSQIRYLDALSEDISEHKDLIYTFFWHDTQNSSFHCKEGTLMLFDTVAEALEDERLMPDTRWLIQTCHSLEWLK